MALRAEAPSFLLPPPGLDTLCGETSHAWQSPCSTAAPSPSVASPFLQSFSPWSEAARSRLASEDFDPIYLSESALSDEPLFDLNESDFTGPGSDLKSVELELNITQMQSKPPGIFKASACEFKLTGMEDLEKCVASLLANYVTAPSTDAGSSPPGTPCEESTTLSSSDEQEVATPAEGIKKKGWGASTDTETSKEDVSEEVPQTSVMVQNVPRRCTRDMFAKMLDEAGFCGDYDLIYVTADLKQRNCGSGSALVNFRTAEACAKFVTAFHKTGVAAAFPSFAGKKAIEVVPAPLQGLDANVRKLEKSGVLMSMLAERPGWRPARYNNTGQIEAEVGDC